MFLTLVRFGYLWDFVAWWLGSSLPYQNNTNNLIFKAMTMQPYNSDKLEFLIDSHHGIYVPKIFSEYFPQYLSDEDRAILGSPDNELYWEVWEEVLGMTINGVEGQKYNLLCIDGDLFAIPENMEYPEF